MLVLKNKDIQIRDPFIYVNENDRKYYMFGSTDKNIWGEGTGFDAYVSEDLENWEGPYPVFRPAEDFYSDRNFWAPEVHEYKGKYYMFATFFRKDNEKRGTAILISDNLLGPYRPHSDGPVTPKEWFSLDGTLHVDDQGTPWLIFCHEWVQVQDGEICLLKLKDDLSGPAEEPKTLFKASEAPWPTAFQDKKRPYENNYVTDGPFIYKTTSGELYMLWASFIDNVYAQGLSKSVSGAINGPWVHEEQPLYREDGGHGMIFKTFDQKPVLTLHAPNKTPLERPIFIELEEKNGKLTVQK